MPHVSSETLENVMNTPATIMATNAGTLRMRLKGTTSERGPRGGSSSQRTAMPGIRPVMATIKKACCQPWNAPIFASGMLLGGASGLALGGVMGAFHGWQHAFFIVAITGLIPGIAVLWLEEPPRGPRSEVVPLSRILSVPAFVAMIVAGVFITFSSVSLLTWGIDFAVNYKDFSLREAAVSLALIALFSLVFGVLMGGWAADRL